MFVLLQCISDDHTLKLCLNDGEDILYKNKDGESTLFIAAMRGSTKCVERLANEKPELLDMTSLRLNQTPLHSASVADHLETVRYLVEQRNASLTSANFLGDTPLLQACYCGASNVIQFLLRKKADLNSLDLYGNNCLMNAAIGGFNKLYMLNVQTLHMVLQIKPQWLNNTNYDGQNALWHASVYGKIVIINGLIQYMRIILKMRG